MYVQIILVFYVSKPERLKKYNEQSSKRIAAKIISLINKTNKYENNIFEQMKLQPYLQN